MDGIRTDDGNLNSGIFFREMRQTNTIIVHIIFTRSLTVFSVFASQTIDAEYNIIREIIFKVSFYNLLSKNF